jgi:hypothetical protein
MYEHYLLILIILTILIIFYGGINKILYIEYEHKYFKCIENIRHLNKYLHKQNSLINIDLKSIFLKIDIIINNLFSVYYINIKPTSYCILKEMFDKSLLMVVYTINNDYNKLQIIIDMDVYNYKESTRNNMDEQLTVFVHDITKDIFITNPYIIYNNYNENTKFILLFIKKPFWYI